MFWPVLHEPTFDADVEAVYSGNTDPYRNFVVRMVFAVSLQRIDTQYAGLADSYYMAAMQYFEQLVRPKDLKTLQCLVLLAQYSLLTPARMPVYYVIGVASRICQQEGLAEEKTITAGYSLDPQTIDMRRRLVWSISTMESGLAYYMGRPPAFAKGDDRMDVEFFATVEDDKITPNGIQSGPQSTRKLITIHIFKWFGLQAEIRRTLYEKKRPEPTNDSHPWYESFTKRLQEWRDSAPTEGHAWQKAW